MMTLRLSPDNFYARAARCRLTYLQGHAEKSRAEAERLLNLEPRQISDLTKAAQSFAFVGEEEKICWAFEQAERRQWLDR